MGTFFETQCRTFSVGLNWYIYYTLWGFKCIRHLTTSNLLQSCCMINLNLVSATVSTQQHDTRVLRLLFRRDLHYQTSQGCRDCCQTMTANTLRTHRCSISATPTDPSSGRWSEARIQRTAKCLTKQNLGSQISANQLNANNHRVSYNQNNGCTSTSRRNRSVDT